MLDGFVRTDDLMKKGLRPEVQLDFVPAQVRTDDLMKKGLRHREPVDQFGLLFRSNR